MKKVCFIETSHDQRDLISILASKAKINDYDFVLLVTNKRLKKIYADLVEEIHICKSSSKYDSYSSLKSFLLEKRTRFWPLLVKPFKEKNVSKSLKTISADIVLTYVGPESIKYIASVIEKENNYDFFFMDQVQNGLRTLTKVPFSKKGCAINKIGKEIDHIPHIGRPRKKKLNSLILFRYDKLRFLEALFSTFNRKIKSHVYKFIFKKSSNCSKEEVILAPQGYTEASFTYCTFSFDSPVKQLFNWSKKQKNINFRWRLHKHSFMRMEWKDFYLIYTSGYKIEDFTIPLESSIKTCKYITTVSSNIIFDSSLHGVPSIALGKSVYHNERKIPFTLSSKKISFHNSLIGFENREWVDSSVDKLFTFFKSNLILKK